jgi:hypothetical protein
MAGNVHSAEMSASVAIDDESTGEQSLAGNISWLVRPRHDEQYRVSALVCRRHRNALASHSARKTPLVSSANQMPSEENRQISAAVAAYHAKLWHGPK